MRWFVSCLASVALACSSSTSGPSGGCEDAAACPAGSICDAGTCIALCASDNDCASGQICANDTCVAGQRTDVPVIASIDADGTLDNTMGNVPHHVVNQLTITGEFFDGAGVSLSDGVTDTPLEICSRTSNELVVELPDGITSGNYTLIVSSQAGNCNATLPVLQGEKGDKGDRGDPGMDGAPGVPCMGCVDANTLATNSVTTSALDTNAVVEGAIMDGAVSANKLGASAVTSSKIDTGAVTTDKIAGGAVDSTKLNLAELQAMRLIPSGRFRATCNATSCTVTDSVNINSVGRTNTGDYMVNFQNALSDDTYTVLCSGEASSRFVSVYTPKTTTGFNVKYRTPGGDQDGPFSCVIFGN